MAERLIVAASHKEGRTRIIYSDAPHGIEPLDEFVEQLTSIGVEPEAVEALRHNTLVAAEKRVQKSRQLAAEMIETHEASDVIPWNGYVLKGALFRKREPVTVEPEPEPVPVEKTIEERQAELDVMLREAELADKLLDIAITKANFEAHLAGVLTTKAAGDDLDMTEWNIAACPGMVAQWPDDPNQWYLAAPGTGDSVDNLFPTRMEAEARLAERQAIRRKWLDHLGVEAA